MYQTDYLIEKAKMMGNYVVDVRRRIHKYPELRWQEERTMQLIVNEVDPMDNENIDICGRVASSGLWYDITIDPSFDRLLFRADIDAVPVNEATGLDFASQNDGVSHACGHDTHITMLLGALKAMTDQNIIPTHNLRFVFQRAEENPGTDPNPESGGHCLVREGILEDISEAYALHILATGKGGIFYSRPGPFLGNSDRVKMTIASSGGHVATPHQGINALRIAKEIMNTLEGLPNRILGPFEPATLEPAILKSGSGSNIMPAQAELWYGVRTMLNANARDEYLKKIEKEVRAVVDKFPEAAINFDWILGHPVLINNPANFNKIAARLKQAGQNVEEHEPILGGEDFAYYLQGRPGSMWMLGASQENCGDHHQPIFNPDESVFWKGVLFWLLLATS